MAKNNIRDWDTTASNNTDIAGIGIQGTNAVSNFDNAFRTIMKQVADVDSGVEPVKDTWSFCDTVDITKKFRFDGGGVTTATTRVLSVPDANTTLAGLGVAQTFTEKQIVSGTSASATERMMDVRDARTTVGGIGNSVFSVARQNSNNPAVTIGNDGNNAGLIGADNATLRIGKWVTGVFTDAIQVLTTGVTNFLGNITGPSDFNISNGNGEEIVLENSTGRVLLRSNSTTLVRVDASGTVIVPNTTFEGTVTVGNGAVSGSAASPTVSFGGSTGWYRTASVLRATYNGTGAMDISDTAVSIPGSMTVGNGGVAGSASAPTIAFGTGIGWYRTASTLRATYNSTAAMDITDTTALVPGTFTVGNGAVAGSASAPTLAFGTGYGFYRTASVIQCVYNSSSAASFSDTVATLPNTVNSQGTYNNTTAAAANMVINASFNMQRSTSALKYKTDVQPIGSTMLDAFLSLSGVTYRSKCEDDDKNKRHIGMIADYAASAGLTELVSYNADGEVEGFQYDRCVALLLEAVKGLRARVHALENA